MFYGVLRAWTSTCFLFAKVKTRSFYVVFGSAGGPGRKNLHLGGLSTDGLTYRT